MRWMTPPPRGPMAYRIAAVTDLLSEHAPDDMVVVVRKAAWTPGYEAILMAGPRYMIAHGYTPELAAARLEARILGGLRFTSTIPGYVHQGASR